MINNDKINVLISAHLVVSIFMCVTFWVPESQKIYNKNGKNSVAFIAWLVSVLVCILILIINNKI